MTRFHQEVASGQRFEFGRNWQRFLKRLNGERIRIAVRSLQQRLGTASLAGTSFLDAGCGSGLFSLAARQLGAFVTSFDYDPHSVACTMALRHRFFPDDPGWEIHQGSVLDRAFLESLGRFDVVYSWGVLHHTGAMWEAMDSVTLPVKPSGRLFIAIYNDQGWQSRVWGHLKRAYCRLPRGLKLPFLLAVNAPIQSAIFLRSLLLLQPHRYVLKRLLYRNNRGMSWWHDLVDWMGGYPFEVATPEAVIRFYRERGYIVDNLWTVRNRQGCNEFVFRNLSHVLLDEPERAERPAESRTSFEAPEWQTIPFATCGGRLTDHRGRRVA